ncbi:hypothetical protein [Olivibacter sp. XZL3]|uniref:hypothetical protein n=1 Tax=Olivibacter sp. XZL3 TaxID=1735116 RepID=UPI001416FFA4|nr:hypothetical protein [Olivibacter sp. XZL3]
MREKNLFNGLRGTNILLFLFILSLLVYSCKKQIESSSVGVQQNLTEQAIATYKKTVNQIAKGETKIASLTRTGSGEAKFTESNFYSELLKKSSLDWKNASVKETRVGPALRVPIVYPRNTTLTINDAARRYKLDEVSYALFYKDSKETMHLEVVTSIPDNDFFENPIKNISTFSGILIIRDWTGKIMRQYRYVKNHQLLKEDETMGTRSFTTQSCHTICAGPFDQDTEGEAVCTTNCGGGDGGGGGYPPPTNPGDPGDGGGGGGGGSGGEDDTSDNPGPDDEIETPIEKNPCTTAKRLNNYPLRGKVADLKNSTSGNVEKGFMFSINDLTNPPHYPTHDVSGNPDQPYIDITASPSNPIDGFVHSHYNGLLPIFSAGDIVALTELYKQGAINDATNFTFALVTADGVYNLGVSDLHKFHTFAQSCPK